MDINFTWEPEHRNYNSRSEELSALSGILSGRVGTIGFRKRSLQGSRTVHVLGRWMVVLCLHNGGSVPSYVCVQDILKRTGITTGTGPWNHFVGAKQKLNVWSCLYGKKEKECSHSWLSSLLQSPQVSFEFVHQFLCNLIEKYRAQWQWNSCKFVKSGGEETDFREWASCSLGKNLCKHHQGHAIEGENVPWKGLLEALQSKVYQVSFSWNESQIPLRLEIWPGSRDLVPRWPFPALHYSASEESFPDTQSEPPSSGLLPMVEKPLSPSSLQFPLE